MWVCTTLFYNEFDPSLKKLIDDVIVIVRYYPQLPKVSTFLQIIHNMQVGCLLWQYRLWGFQGRDTKLERFLAKKQL